MSDAYYEKIARINLTTGEIKVEPLDLEVAKKFIGGRGLGTKILYDEGVATVDPLSPENKLVYITGPMTGSNSPSSGRYMVVTKSPLTGMIACANSGGIWGAKLKFAGWDALIVEGQAPDWCYLNIADDKIEILDAREYCGVLSEELDDKLKEKHGADCSVLNIGPAGEKQVLLAAVMNDKDRAAGRSGVGAVMGSKKLKAIVVKATRKQLDVIADVEALKEANKRALKIIADNGVTGQGLRALGTAVLVNIINGIGALPTRNWQESYCPTADQFSGETLAEKYLKKPGACYHCPIACGRVINHGDKVVGGPEYEPLWAYGSDCGNDDLYTIDECNRLCNEYGLDAIGVPCTIAAAMELYQRGFIKEEDCAGVPLEWGSKEALVEWTKRTPRVLHERQEAGDPRLRRPRHPGHRHQLCHRQLRRRSRARLHDLPRGPRSAAAAGPHRHHRQGRLDQDLPGSDRRHRLHGQLPVHLLCPGRPGIRGSAQRRHRHHLDCGTASGDRRPHLQHRAYVQQGRRHEARG